MNFFFFQFPKSILNFKHLQKKDDPRSGCISGNTVSEKYAEINVRKSRVSGNLRQTTRQMSRTTVAI